MRIFVALLLLTSSFIADSHALEKAALEPSSPSAPIVLLKDPVQAALVEMPGDALPFWRSRSGSKFPIVVFAQFPFLAPMPVSLRQEAAQLAAKGSAAALHKSARLKRPQPVLPPDQTLSAAIEAKLVSEILWIIPFRKTAAKLELDTFRLQAVQSQLLTKKEADALVLENGIIKGTVRGLPLRIAQLDELPPLENSCIVHMDLSFFQHLYQNEIATPLYSTVHSALTKIRQVAWPISTLTISFSTEEGEVPLELRHLGSTLKDIFAAPETLDSPLPENLQSRKKALYLETFFQVDDMLDTYLQMEKNAPDDAAVKFDLSRVAGLLRNSEKQREFLAEAAALDPGYAYAYLPLALMELDKKNRAMALESLQQARKFMPDNPFIEMQIAQTSLQLGRCHPARASIHKLLESPWSSTYYPEVPEKLNEMDLHAATICNQSTDRPTSPPRPAGKAE